MLVQLYKQSLKPAEVTHKFRRGIHLLATIYHLEKNSIKCVAL